MPANNTTPPNLQSLNNYPTWYTDYGESPTSIPPELRDLIYQSGYDPDKVLEDFDDLFDAYDPTREQFAQQRLQGQEEATTLNYEQSVGQAEREQSLLQAQLGTEGYFEPGAPGDPGRWVEGKKGFLGQALDRQRASLAIQRSDVTGAQQRLEGYTDPETGEKIMGGRQIAQEQVGIQRGLAEDEQGFAERDFATAGERLGLREEEIGASAERQQAQLKDRLMSLGIDEAEAERQAASQVAGVGREEERLGLARGAAEEASEFQLGRLGRQQQELDLQAQQDELARSGLDLSGREIDIQEALTGQEREEIGLQRQLTAAERGQFGLQREASEIERLEAEAGLTQLQTEIGQRTGSARQQMLQAYQAGEMDTSGFAGSGARDTAQQRAIQAYAGDAAAGMQGLRVRGESLRRGLGRFDIAGREIGLQEELFDIRAGRQDIAERKLDIGAGRYDVERERLGLREGQLDISADRRGIGEADLRAQEEKEKADLDRQLSQYDISAADLSGRRADIAGGLAAQQQRIGINVGAVDRGIADVAAAEARQIRGVGLDRDAQQTSYDRKLSQLGGQLSGYDLQDASDRLRFDEQAGRLESQAAQLGIQDEGALARFKEQRMGAASRLSGIESQLGEGGFLQRGLQNQLGMLGGRFAEEVYGIRDQYGDEVRDRIMDLIRDEGINEESYGINPFFGRFEVEDDLRDQGNLTRGGSGGACFLAGTNVETSKGKQPIESIKVGDTVLSTDLKSKDKVQSKVTETFVHDDVDKYLVINDKIKATPNHPFYSNGEWKEIGELSIGDKILHVDGIEHNIESIEQIDEPAIVYNIEVDENHNYFAEGYLVHNK